MKKTQILMNKPIYLGLSILDLRKTVIYEFWYDYVKPKYGENAKMCFIDTDSFMVHVKTDDIHKGIAEDVEKRFDTSNVEIERPLPIEKNKRAIGLMKDELGGQIMKKVVGLRAKTCNYLKTIMMKMKKQKEQRKCAMKMNFKFRDYEKCFKASQIENKINYLQKKTDIACLKEDKKEILKIN